MQINPTRIELKRLKHRLAIAVKGHKMLKDKTDELIRRFMQIFNSNKELRLEVEAELKKVFSSFVFARAISGEASVFEALMTPTFEMELDFDSKKIMGVKVPVFSQKMAEGTEENNTIFPYSFISTTVELDDAVYNLKGMIQKMLKLAEIEKTCSLLSFEIERTRRRVNALEYEVIPKLETQIKYISMKLAENERGNIVRLMKVKAMIEARNEG